MPRACPSVQLLTMRKIGGYSLEEVEFVFDQYIKKQKSKKNSQLEEIHQNNLYLNEDEEGLLTNVVLLFVMKNYFTSSTLFYTKRKIKD